MTTHNLNQFWHEVELREDVRNESPTLAAHLDRSWDKLAPRLHDYALYRQLLLITDIKEMAWQDNEDHQIDDHTESYVMSLLKRIEDSIFRKMIDPDKYERESWDKEEWRGLK